MNEADSGFVAELSHAFHQGQVRLLFRKDNLGRRVAVFLHGVDKGMQVLHIHGNDIEAEQSVSCHHGDTEDFGPLQEVWLECVRNLARSRYFDIGAHLEAH